MNPIRQMDEKLRSLGVKPFEGSAFQPLSGEELGRIEECLGTNLPAAYRHFLLTYGEAGFSENVYFRMPPGHELYEFGYFYGFASIMDGIQSPPDTMPENMFPIGDEGLGNLYCLGFSRKQRGEIYYWDQNIGWEADADAYIERGEPVPEDLPMQPLSRIAHSFEAFIELLLVKD